MLSSLPTCSLAPTATHQVLMRWCSLCWEKLPGEQQPKDTSEGLAAAADPVPTQQLKQPVFLLSLAGHRAPWHGHSMFRGHFPGILCGCHCPWSHLLPTVSALLPPAS